MSEAGIDRGGPANRSSLLLDRSRADAARIVFSFLTPLSSTTLPFSPPRRPRCHRRARVQGRGRRQGRGVQGEAERRGEKRGGQKKKSVSGQRRDALSLSLPQPPSPPLLLPCSQAKSAIASVGSDDVQDKLAALGEDIKAAWAKTDDKPAVVVLGGAALVALVAANAVVTTVDGVPVLSSLLQLIGLIVSGWFTYRYLAFKPDREELVRSIDAYLAKVLGK